MTFEDIINIFLLLLQLKNEEFRKEWESLAPEYAIMKALIEARTSQGLTQNLQISSVTSRHDDEEAVVIRFNFIETVIEVIAHDGS